MTKMKIKAIIIVVSLLLLTDLKAQKSFQKGNVLLSPAIGLANNYGYRNYNAVSPSIFFSADFGVHDYVSVGPYGGATFFNGATGIDFGARGSFHWWQLLDDKVEKDLKQNQVDVYATLWMGGEIVQLGNGNNVGRYDAGFTQGIRWYPNANNRFALLAEFGYTPIAFANLGATIKIGR